MKTCSFIRSGFKFIRGGLLLSCALTLPVAAEIYRWVDDQGNVEFSDVPREGAEKVEVGPTATITLPKLSDIDTAPAQEDTVAAPPYEKLLITFPEHDSAFNTASGDVTVMMEVVPGLYPNHSLRLTLDGSQSVTTKQNFHKFSNVDRGTHQLTLEIVDNSGVVLAGPTVTFTVHRPSVLRRN